MLALHSAILKRAMKRIYLLSTKHFEKALWFREKEDFKVAMNYIAVQAAKHPEVVVIAFVLMSNHVHFVLNGTRADVIAFITEFKRCYSIYYKKKYGVHKFLRENGVHVEEVKDEYEAIERVVAYVLDNPVAANICSHPSLYPWSSASSYFNSDIISAMTVGDLSRRDRLKLFHTPCDSVPKGWLVDASGFILPVNYVNYRFVEERYKTPKRMNYFLVNSSKAKNKYESEDNIISFTDQTVLHSLPDICRSLFQKSSFSQLNPAEQSECAKQIRYRFSSDASQIARVCGVSYEEAARLLDNYSG